MNFSRKLTSILFKDYFNEANQSIIFLIQVITLFSKDSEILVHHVKSQKEDLY